MSLLSRFARMRTAVLALAIGAAALTMAASPAMAATSPAAQARPTAASVVGSLELPALTSPGNIYNPNSGKCIGIDASGYAGIWPCTSNNDQTWQWQNQFFDGNGIEWGQLVNGNGVCLGVSAGSTSQGARIRSWTCEDVANQYWHAASGNTYITNYGGFYTNGSSGPSIIGVHSGATTPGASLVLWTPLGHADQAWVLE
jgi:hypothetical protein